MTGDDPDADTRRRWQLDERAFAALLDSLHSDRTLAAQEYERLRRRLVRYFSVQGIARAAEAADEAFNRLAKRLHEGEAVRRVESYLAGIARLLLLEERQREQRERDVIASMGRESVPVDEPRGESDASAAAAEERLLQALEECLGALPSDSRELLRCYYAGEGGERVRAREALAGRLGISPNTLRNRVLRLREKLENAVRDRLDHERGHDVRPSSLTSWEEGE